MTAQVQPSVQSTGESRYLDFNCLGDEMKMFEKRFQGKYLMPGIPILMRFDGNAFHTFTRNLDKPYDRNLAQVFQCVVDELIKELCPDVAYHQSDEISLLWFNDDTSKQLSFSGNVDKWLSIYAAKCSVLFNRYLLAFMPNKAAEGMNPVFDARVWQVPRWEVAYRYFLWRQWDARKNSVSMAAHSLFSNNELLGKNTAEKIEMLRTKGINFSEYPESFRQGTFTRKMKKWMPIEDEIWNLIPDKNKPESRIVERSAVCVVPDIPKLTSVNISDGSFAIFHKEWVS